MPLKMFTLPPKCVTAPGTHGVLLMYGGRWLLIPPLTIDCLQLLCSQDSSDVVEFFEFKTTTMMMLKMSAERFLCNSEYGMFFCVLCIKTNFADAINWGDYNMSHGIV